MMEPRVSHRTRSKAAPDWSPGECLVLVNEINAIESEWGATLPSYQKWKQIVDNCNSLDVNRNLNQCRRKWDDLFNQYRRVKNGPGGNGSLQGELFDAIDRCVSAKGKRSGGDEVEEEEVEGLEAAKLEDDEEEEQAVMDTDPDSDPEAQGRVTKVFFETGSKKQKRRMKRKKRRIEKLNPWGYFTSPKVKLEDSSNLKGKLENTNSNIGSLHEESTVETKEQIMCAILRENALQINAIVEGNIADDADYKLADLKNTEAVQMDLRRQQGDKLIVYLEKISNSLKDFYELVEQCK